LVGARMTRVRGALMVQGTTSDAGKSTLVAGPESALALDYNALREASIDRLADAMTQHLHLARLHAELR